MNANDTIRAYALEHVGCPYIFGATAKPCTPSYRKARMAQYPDYAASIQKYCPVLSGKQGACAGCKYEGKLAFDCAQLTRYAAKAAGIELPSGARSQFTKANWAVKDTIDKLQPGQVAFLYRVTSSGSVPHTGIALGDGTFVDARGHSQGVLHSPMSSCQWTHFCIQPAQEREGEPVSTILSFGATGDQVRELQKDLIRLGYDLGKWGADGKFGSQTAKAVREFQAAYGMPVTGAWSDEDEERLAIVLADDDVVQVPRAWLEELIALVAKIGGSK